MRLPTILHKVTACCLLVTLSANGRLCASEEDSTLELLDPKTFDYNSAAHLLSRAGFGGTPEEIQGLEKIGLDAAVSKLLSGAPDDDPVGDFQVETTDKPMGRREFRRLPQEKKKRLRQQFRRCDTQQCQRLRAWWIRRMVLTPRPLEEKMLLFWHGPTRGKKLPIPLSSKSDLAQKRARKPPKFGTHDCQRSGDAEVPE